MKGKDDIYNMKLHIENHKKLNIDLYKKLYLIRKSELTIQKYYGEDDMKTPMHMSMGEEAIVVGVCSALQDTDQIFATYRSHGAFLAKSQDIDFFFAEMYAKDISPLKGKGGSMHLCYPECGIMGTSAIVASHIPIAVGAAFANKIKKNENIVVVFFGDGATDEGVFWESINVASLMKLPIIFVCEDNGLAVHTSTSTRHCYDSITEIISKFNYYILESDSTDVEKIYHMTLEAIEMIKGSFGDSFIPIFMNLRYYRYLEHVGINEDFNANYRSKEEFIKWYKKDSILLQREKLLSLGVDIDEIKQIEKDIENNIEESIIKVKNAPISDKENAYKHVFKTVRN